MNKIRYDWWKDFAIKCHGDQKRNDCVTPYWVHPVRVSLMVIDDSTVIALLHDIVEDTKITLEGLRNQCTPYELQPYELQAIDNLTHRKNEERAKYITRVCSDYYSSEVKIADMLDNMTDGATPGKIQRYKSDIIRIATYDND